MKRNIVGTTLFFAMLLLILGAVASAQDDDWGVRRCSTGQVAGEWAYTLTGTVITPTGPVPTAAIARSTIDAHGNVSSKQTSSTGGAISEWNTVKGTIAVNPDCTGTKIVMVYDSNGNLQRTVTEDLVIDDHAREIRALVTSLVLPNGASVPTIITITERKLF